MDRKYLIFAATGVGLGHLMGAILGSAYYAYRTGRVFAMDMREVIFFTSDNHNAFFENFEVQLPQDLEVITDLEVIDHLKRDSDLHFVTLSTPLDIDRPFVNRVVMVPCITPGDPFKTIHRRPEQVFRINLKASLAEALNRALAHPMWSRRVIGVHYRATIGELFERMTKLTVPDYDERYQAVKDQYVETALRLVENAAPDSFAFLVASDDREFVAEMKARLPNSFSLTTLRLDQEFMAYMKANKHDLAILVDAVTDLWALSRCEQLLFSRSAFTHFAIMNSEHLDDTNTFYVHMPLFDEILRSLRPEVAVEWAYAAAKKIDISRMHYDKMHRYLADALDRAGRPEEALMARQKADWHDQAAHAPEIDNPGAFDERAQQRAGVNDLALTRARRAAERLPDNPYLHGGFGGSLSTLLIGQGEAELAIEAGQRAVDLDPSDPFLREHLATIQIRAGKFDAAEASVRSAIEMLPDIATFHLTLAMALGRQGQHENSISAAEHALRLDASLSGAYTRIGEALLDLGRNAEAEQSFAEAISRNPKDPGYFHRLSIALERQGRIDEAIAASQRGADADVTQSYCLERAAALLLRKGDAQAALNAAERAVKIRPTSADANRLLEEAKFLLNEPSDSVNHQIEVYNVSETPEFHIQKAMALLSDGAFPEAEAASRTAVSMRPDNAGFRHVLSIALERQGRLDDAMLEAEESVRLDPADTNREARLASMSLLKGDAQAAVDRARGILSRQPGHEFSRRVLLDALDRTGQFDHAIALALELAAARPDDENVTRRAAVLREKQETLTLARELAQHVDLKVLQTLGLGFGHLQFSAFGEDGVLLHLLRNVRSGFYVDVGAHHPYRLSNTAMLHVFNGWHGINIDADQRSVEQFRIYRPDDVNLCCGVGAERKVAKMAIFEDGAINSFDAEWIDRQQDVGGRKIMEVRELQIHTLPELLDTYLPKGQEIDLLNVDAEGWDTEILESNDWNRYRPKLVLVEDHRMSLSNVSGSPTYLVMKSNGYELISQTLATSIYRLVS